MARLARRFAFRLALAFAGAGLVVAGLVLLLRAGGLALAAALGPVWAAVILGGALVLFGGLVITATTRPKRAARSVEPDVTALAVAAFFQGLAAGQAVRGRHRGKERW